MDPKLYEAAVSGDVDFLRRNAIHQDFDLDQQTPDNSTALHVAVIFRRQEFARELIQLNPSLIQHANTYGDTPLHIAAKVGSSEIAERLIKVADLENGEVGLCMRTNLAEDTALHIAVRYGHLDVVKLLMRRHPELSGFSNIANETPIFIAIEGGFTEIASEILRISPSPPCGGRDGTTALHAAVIRTQPGQSAKDHVPAALITLYNKTTFSYGLCLDYDKCFQSSHQIDIVRELVEKYPTMIKETDMHGWTALHYAAHIGHTEAIKFLVDHDSSLAYLKTNEGMSALHIAAMAGHVDVTREIIRTRPDACYVLDNMRQTFLHVAVKNRRSAVVEYIVENWKLEGVLNVRDENGNTALHLAAISTLHLAASYAYSVAAINIFSFSHEYMLLKSLAWDSRVDKKIMNNQHLTAIDIVIANEQIPNIAKNLIIKAMKQGGSRQSLEGVMGRKYGEEINTITSQQHSNQMKNYETEFKHLNHISATHLLVATLIATVTFAAGFTVPGGYLNSGDKEGTPVLISKSSFKAFIVADSLAFFCSIASILLHFSASTMKIYNFRLTYTKTAAKLIYVSLIGVLGAFVFGLDASIPDSSLSYASLCIVLSAFVFILYNIISTKLVRVFLSTISAGCDGS